MNELLNTTMPGRQAMKLSCDAKKKEEDGSSYTLLKCETGMPEIDALGPHLLITRTILVANSVPEYDVPSVYVIST